jgi:hypothetical protein
MVHAAVGNIALGCVPQPDEIPCDLLTGAIGQCAGRAAPDVGCGTATARLARPADVWICVPE